MHHFFSFLFSILLSPFNWIIILLLAAWVFRKKSTKRFCFIFAFCIFILFGNPALFNWYAAYWQPPPVAVSSLGEYSCGIVLGGFAGPDEKGNGYFNATSDRFIQAVKLYKLGKVKHLLISGGNGKQDDNNFREASWIKGEMIIFGVPDSVIFVEDKSVNTQENAINSKQMLDSLQLKPPYLLITSAWHIPRAALLFQKAGVRVVSFPCNYNAGHGIFSFWDLLPKPSAMAGWDPYLKETFGYWWYEL